MPASTARKCLPLHTFTGCDVPWLLDQQSRARPDETFLVWESYEGAPQSWTFAQFNEQTRAFAAGFAASGVAPGDIVTIHMENCPEFLFAFFACARIGALAVTTNTGSTAEELEYFLTDSRASFVVTQPKFVPLLRTDSLKWTACTGASPPPGWKSFEELRGDSARCPVRGAEPMRPSHVQYTSGTTSRPKGVVWTHANALWGARVTSNHARLVDTDVVPIFFPLFHANALAYTLLPTLWTGGTVVLTPK